MLVAICAVLWFAVVPNYVEGEQQSFFPRLAIVWIAVFATLTAIFPPKADTGDGAASEEVPVVRSDVAEDGDADFPSVYPLMVLWGLYAIAVDPLGFYLATFLMLTSSMYYLGIRKVTALLLRPTVALLLIYLLLDVALNFRLPEAFWQ